MDEIDEDAFNDHYMEWVKLFYEVHRIEGKFMNPKTVFEAYLATHPGGGYKWMS